MKRLTIVLSIAMGVVLFVPALASGFGFASLNSTYEANGGPATLAGSHPTSQTTEISFETVPDPANKQIPAGAIQNLTTSLPAGFVGNPTAVTPCGHQQFVVGECPAASEVGTVEVELGEAGSVLKNRPVLDLTPPPGDVLQLGFGVESVPVTVDVKVNPNPPFNVLATVRYASNELSVYRTVLTIDNNPPGSSVPFLTLPRACTGPLFTGFEATSWQEPSTVVSGQSASSLTTTGCGELGFGPTIKAAGTSEAGESPSGLDLDLEVNDPGLVEEGKRADSDIEKAVVTLPEGMTTNPSIASGLTACSEAQFNAEGVEFDPTTGCPQSSNVGTVEVTTPLLHETLSGQIYVAKQGANPFGSLLALYMVIRDERLGIVVRQPIKIEPDPNTGRLVSTVSDIPQLPFSDFHLHFRDGARAPLITPAVCGEFSVNATLYPYAQGVPPVQATAGLRVNSGAGGSGCASGVGGLPNAPTLSAGTLSPVAGAYSPLVLRIARADGSQQISSISTTLPEGLVGRLTGIGFCPEAGIAQAESRTGEGQGALEIAQPSCPAASEVGTATVASGAGPSPLYVSGHVYLAGPYKGAPLSLEVITPAIAGPFDLGVVAVRTALQVDPRTAQITAESARIPTILHGLPLDVREIAIDMNRADFTLNPTSCEPKTILGSETSTLESVASLSQYFQATNCSALKFKPKFSVSTSGKTSKANGASLTVKLSQQSGEANIHKVNLTLPTVLPARLTTLQQACTEAQFNVNPAGCPSGSFIGTAKAVTPILSVPLTGPAILVSHGGAAFPDVVFLLQANERGADIRIDLDGKTDIKKGVTYSRFETVPDAPIANFETNLPQGPHSVLAATGNLCASKLAIPTEMVGQNGALVSQSTKLTVTGCPKAKVLTRAQKLALALKACHKMPKGRKRQTCEKAARHKYGPVIKRKGKKK